MVSKDKTSEYYRKKTQNTDYSNPTSKGGISNYINAELSNPALPKKNDL